MASVVRGTSLRAGGACVRCRKGKTKCVYENNRAPCKNCAKGMHECYLPSESLAHHHGQSPARVPRPRESLPGERSVSTASHDRPTAASQPLASRTVTSNNDKLTPELVHECERIINKTLPACVAFHKPGFLQKLKNGTLENSIVNGLLTIGARSSAHLTRRYGGQGGASAAAEHFAVKTISMIMQNLDNPSVADIQALCLLIIHEWGSRNAIRAYVYLGQAARMAQMHRIVSSHYTPKAEAEQFIKDESFRRTLWLIYILDCFLTSSPGRHPALTAHDVKDIALPCPDMSFSFGSPVCVRTLSGQPPRDIPDPAIPLAEVGEFGHIVMATQAWRNVIEMLTSVEVETFSEAQCDALEKEIEAVRQGLPMHFMDKAGHINLHITMGSGFTYAMLHCLLHCATIMVNRRRLLQYIRTEGFSEEQWRSAAHVHLQAVDQAFASAHGIVSLLLALDADTSKDGAVVFPLVMLFACFEAGATVAWFSLKGLTPANVNETSLALVRDAMRFLQEGTDAWTLSIPWYRHLSVMAKVLRNGGHYQSQPPKMEPSPPVKDDIASQPDSNPDPMDYDRPASTNPPDQVQDRESEPPRTSGFAAINGGSIGANTPATASPPPAPQPAKIDSPRAPSSAGGAPAEQAPVQERTTNDMTATELCEAFENQLLELDDLAAFMGGGV
ncbi:putative Zn(2)-C6 fungal-type domain-containing protein [Seiridium cardinale]|uniref:Zn(2)-C6 fungal-type domain-containing protein n=1 Tax=Seiridium cardinale TaxID=138064 RepID=A0ABR2Y945_9PEZI